jgi:hypothetical protein
VLVEMHGICAFLIGVFQTLGWIVVVLLGGLALRRFRWSVLVILLSFPGCFVGTVVENSLGGRRADQIVMAINEYHRDEGRFPVRLSELTPKYLRAIPRTTVGLEWRYPYYFSDGSTEWLLAYGGQDCGYRRGHNAPGYGLMRRSIEERWQLTRRTEWACVRTGA